MRQDLLGVSLSQVNATNKGNARVVGSDLAIMSNATLQDFVYLVCALGAGRSQRRNAYIPSCGGTTATGTTVILTACTTVLLVIPALYE